MSQRVMTQPERNLVLRALGALKGKTEPSSPQWSEITKLWDAIIKGVV